ncbi:uncharacterized protein BCR38DRAFT_415926 [Pseudomassariella vexata]|uniref:Uncharacterized protein n=1 Tax=Pseudomassariella vexata TaxID=1141098 RepID=A0A1Y2EHQ4_9PEZI|nr:uncharacterized protein BCR38DRAFT_415926 [Pseudomassariella vexata]ORY71098.1 hypothetical protein BCR38DRAFT_415926 [Pseudomassariella vexata]
MRECRQLCGAHIKHQAVDRRHLEKYRRAEQKLSVRRDCFRRKVDDVSRGTVSRGV